MFEYENQDDLPSPDEENIPIRVVSDLVCNFSMIPNAVIDVLDAQELALYVHLVRIAGQNGKCFASTRTLSEKCHLSVGTISNLKQSLLEKKLITIEEKYANNNIYHEIRMVDVWERKEAAYSVKKKKEPPAMGGVHQVNRGVHQVNGGCSPGERINMLNNINIKKRATEKSSVATPLEKTSLHPALKAYRHIARLNIQFALQDKVIEIVGSDPSALKKWEEIIRDWIGHGWKKTNINGMLECFEKGGIQEKRNGNGKVKQPSMVYPAGVKGHPSLETAWSYIKYNSHHKDDPMCKPIYDASVERLSKAGIQIAETENVT